MAEEDVAEKSVKAGLGDKIKDLITKIKSSKKMMIIVGSGALLILLVIGGATYYLLSGDEPSEEVVIDDTDKEIKGTTDDEEIAKAKFESVHIFPLEPFFMPIRLKNNKESEHFLLVTTNFRMSNSRLNSEINKKLPLIREKMYSILRRENLKDLTENNIAVQDRVKKAFQDRVNELLPVGSGVIKEVLFKEFIIK